MGFMLLPVAVLAFFLSIFAVQRVQITAITPTAAELTATQTGQMFIWYRDAVATYMNANPTFTGTVSSSSLAAQGNIFSSYFLALASNGVTATASGGRVITVFGNLPGGALKTALDKTDNDLSLGLSNGTTWTSAAAGAGQVALATPVPSGNVVSVNQIGN